MQRRFNGEKAFKLGTERNPAMVSVQSEERALEVSAIFEENDWVFTLELDPDQPEDISDLESLQNRPEQVIAEPKVGRNDPCPCGSGKKFKKCCGK